MRVIRTSKVYLTNLQLKGSGFPQLNQSVQEEKGWNRKVNRKKGLASLYHDPEAADTRLEQEAGPQ